MVDTHMQYSCGYWKEATTLEQAQQAKLRMICEKLQLQPGTTLLDIGCVWGGLAAYAARHYGVSVYGVTISREQQKLAQARCSDLNVSIELQDYRDLNRHFDRIVSVGMFEHVGPKITIRTFASSAKISNPTGCFCCIPLGQIKPIHRLTPGLTNISSPTAVCPPYVTLPHAVNPIW